MLKGKARLIAPLAAFAWLVLATGQASAGFSPGIKVKDDFFSPGFFGTTVTQVGPNTGWLWNEGGTTTNLHNIREDHKLFYSGNPVNTGEFDVQISAGTFHYYCELDGSRTGGMDGGIAVKPISTSSAPVAGTDQFNVTWAFGASTGDRFDVQYRINGGDWIVWKNRTDTFDASFGHNDNPVDVQNGNTYSFRARSEKSSNPVVRRSGWSPRLNVAIPVP